LELDRPLQKGMTKKGEAGWLPLFLELIEVDRDLILDLDS
jgi:hypothetical protein